MEDIAEKTITEGYSKNRLRAYGIKNRRTGWLRHMAWKPTSNELARRLRAFQGDKGPAPPGLEDRVSGLKQRLTELSLRMDAQSSGNKEFRDRLDRHRGKLAEIDARLNALEGEE
jgi:hypothetical protein